MAATRNVQDGVNYTNDKQRELFNIHILFAAGFEADNFTDLFPVRKLPIRWPWDVVEEHMASSFINGHHCERILLFILGDELHRVLQMRESSYHFGNRLHVAINEGQRNGVQLRCREGFWGHETRYFESMKHATSSPIFW